MPPASPPSPTQAAQALLEHLRSAGEEAHARTLETLITQTQDLARARQAAEAANEAKTRFLASISHEIRSPLNAIYGYAQLLERGDAASTAKAASVIRRSSEHLSNLVEGLLDMAQVESGSLKLSREPFRLRAFLEQIIAMLELQASAKGLALSLDCPPGLPEFVRGDEKRLRQILINLLTNAIKFTDHGAVTLKLHYRNEIATFEVIDTGIGIAPQDQERIFAPFERAETGDAPRSGVGLGLAITQALVQIMGGDIRVESTPGQGTRFIVRLMLSKPLVPPVDAPATRRLNHYLGHTRTVMVVDDDEAQRTLLKSLLEPQGLRVLTADTGRRALALAEQAQPDLVLLDVMLGADDGWQVASALRERHGSDLSIIMLSGEAGSSGTASAKGPANDLFVTKPFNVDALFDRLAQQLALAWPSDPATDRQPPSSPTGPLPARLAADAAGHLASIEQLVKIGHVRAIEAEITALAALGDEAQPLAETMRGKLDDFDLQALATLARRARTP